MPLLLVLCFLLSPARGQQLYIRLADADSLRLPFSLPQLLGHLETRLAGLDRPLYQERVWRTIRAFYSFQTAKREITLLTQVIANLHALYGLDRQQAAAALAEDRKVLEAQNALLLREIELLRKKEECRAHLLTLLEICFLEIDNGSPPPGPAAGLVRNRK